MSSDKGSDEDKDSRQYQKSIDVGAFLGAITLAILVLLLESNSNPVFCSNQTKINQTSNASETNYDFCKFITSNGQNSVYYKQFLIGSIGIISTLLVTSIFGMKVAYIEKRPRNYPFARLSICFYEAGFIGVSLLLPILVLPFSTAGGIIIIIILIGWGIMILFDKFRLFDKIQKWSRH